MIAALLLACLLGAAAADSAVAPARTPDYWNAWGVVFVKATCDVEGHVLKAEVAQGTAAPAVLDSLIVVAKGRTLEIPHYGGIAPDLIHGIAFVTERHPRASERAGWIGLPEELNGALANPPLDAWLREMLEIAPGFDLGDFLAHPPGNMMRMSVPIAGPGSDAVERREQGLLLDSPDGGWTLDLLANGEMESDGHLGWDVDTALSIRKPDTGAIAFQYTLGTADIFWAATWLDDDRFLVVGCTDLGAGFDREYVRLVAPSVGLFTLSANSAQWFTGGPIHPEDEARFGELGRIVRMIAFPKVDWRD